MPREKTSYACKRLEKKQIDIKEEPFIECHSPLQELPLLFSESLSFLLHDLEEKKRKYKRKKEKNYIYTKENKFTLLPSSSEIWISDGHL